MNQNNFVRVNPSSNATQNSKKNILLKTEKVPEILIKHTKPHLKDTSKNKSSSSRQNQTDPQECVRMSLVSVDQKNKENPQEVAIYCQKIFQWFLKEEVY